MKSSDAGYVAVGAIGLVAGMAALIAVTSVWRGYVLQILWGWFAVPAFGLPVLSIPFAIGTSLIVGYLARDTNASRKDQSFGSAVASGCLTPAFALLIGWIVAQFI